MMTRIYLIRHAEAEGNLYRIVQGQGNSNLTDRGWRQVKALEQRFTDIHIDAVYTSDLYRTCATASAIFKPKGLTPHRRKDLREIYVGDWEGRTWGDIARTAPEQMEYFSRRPDLWYSSGAETPLEVLRRVKEAVTAIAAENEGKTVAVFSHGYAIRLLLADLQGYPPERMGESPTGQNTAVSLLEAENGTLQVVFRDDISHLQTPEYLSQNTARCKSDPLEPGLWFQPLDTDASHAADILKDCWAEGGIAGAFDVRGFQTSIQDRHTLVGYSRETPVGLVQMGPEAGWISLACIREGYRSRGFGVQLIGQAVQWTRALGGETLYIALTEGNAAKVFSDYGFVPTGTAEDGRTVFAKDIRFLSEFLGEG